MVKSVLCSRCNQKCEFVDWKIRIPSPKKQKEWRKFWDDYRREKAVLEAHRSGHRVETTELEILNLRLVDGRWQDRRNQA